MTRYCVLCGKRHSYYDNGTVIAETAVLPIPNYLAAEPSFFLYSNAVVIILKLGGLRTFKRSEKCLRRRAFHYSLYFSVNLRA